MSTEEMLDHIDTNDNVIGMMSRKEIHAKGLLHREVAILFVTPDGYFIFQRRSMKKATNPGLLAFTVAGHVVSGDTYEEAVLKEAEEETGLKLSLSDLVLIKKDHAQSDANNCLRVLYGYVFKDSIDQLRIEEDEGDGFVLIPGKNIFDLPDQLRKNVATSLLDPARYKDIYSNVLALVQ
ncbi:MAG TPA: NUDIX domain-containing protein [Alphaproteobacteria bacterium]